MKLKHLESLLSEVAVFENPKVDLEQIPTSPEIASRMIFTAANTFEDIIDCSVGDFGCGPGVLSIGASAMGSCSVTGYDVDSEALETCSSNLRNLEIINVDLVNIDIQSLNLSFDHDTILMNPPFGTRNTGIDTAFLLKGMAAANVVYSLHKTSTRKHFVNLSESQNFRMEVLAELRYDIPKTFKYHTKRNKDIYVDLYRFTHS